MHNDELACFGLVLHSICDALVTCIGSVSQGFTEFLDVPKNKMYFLKGKPNHYFIVRPQYRFIRKEILASRVAAWHVQSS